MFSRVVRPQEALLGRCIRKHGVAESLRCSAAMFSVRSSSPRLRQGEDANLQEDADLSGNSSSLSPEGLKAFRDVVTSRTAAISFSDEEVDPPALREIMALTQSAPSSFNIQPWSVVVVRDTAARERLSTAMLGGNAKKVLAAPVTAVFCADLEPSKRINRMVELNRKAGMPEAEITKFCLAVNLFSGEGVVGNAVRNAVTTIASPMQPAPEVASAEAWSFKNTALAVQTYILSCTAHGLDTAPMEGFDARRVRAALDIPDRYGIPIIVPTGYPAPSKPEGQGGGGGVARRWRYPPQEVVFDGTFGVGMTGVDPVVP
ncbi:conserved unknown protein [Ectocarpus siliculosus]|uniref:Nitroreductase domain-containing protein n=1 Tax=Ectocarpus siliculosus TaxID=2880 RepID=D8LMQ3_ECTSI|nr:conserved unknown protein [Ectocarpus siliculosus]|eukprot:CBN76229.1 conserved unknown protein [Ectocarpus siliculosus]